MVSSRVDVEPPAGITDSILVNDSTLDPAQQKRVTAWLDAVARKDISFEKPTDSGNNHHYWRGLAATSVGVAASDGKLFKFGVETYRGGISDIDRNGALPKEMARHENAIHYQGFALEPLVVLAQFAAGQGVDLYGYENDKRSLRDAILFFGRAVDDAALVKALHQRRSVHELWLGQLRSLRFLCGAIWDRRFAAGNCQCVKDSDHKHPAGRQHDYSGRQVVAAWTSTLPG